MSTVNIVYIMKIHVRFTYMDFILETAVRLELTTFRFAICCTTIVLHCHFNKVVSLRHIPSLLGWIGFTG